MTVCFLCPMQCPQPGQRIEETPDVILRKSSAPEKTCLWERSSVFNAYYLPGVDANLLAPDMAPVNSFRVVLNEYFDANLEYLPDKTYFTSHRLILYCYRLFHNDIFV